MATIGYAICFLIILLVQVYEAHKATINEQDADEYLEKFGYLDKVGGGRQRSPLVKTRAVKSFQEFAHLPVTGRLDEPTKRAMLAPRCGVVDKSKNTRAGFVSKWDKDVLTWALVKPTSQLDSGRVRTAIKQALAVWSKVVPLNFTEVQAQSGADLQFGFDVGDHGDGYNFDGPGGTLAHAFYPSNGRLHFDDDERWAFEDGAKIQDGGYTDLLSVTIHEFGHSLGLPHSNEEDAIMFPFYRGPEVDAKGNLVQFQLSRFDIQDIQNIYGPREGATTRPPPTPEPTPPGPPSGAPCPRFDAALTGLDGVAYFFTKGSDVGWTKANGVDAPANSATKFYVSRRFPGAPSNGITAAFTDRGDELTFLFQGRRVFGYSWKASTKRFTLVEGYPKDLPSEVSFEPEGAFQTKEGRRMLFGGDEFVFWDQNVNTVLFKNSVKVYFRTLPSNAKASIAVGEDKLYFLNAADYSVYDFGSSTVVSTRPLKSLIVC